MLAHGAPLPPGGRCLPFIVILPPLPRRRLVGVPLGAMSWKVFGVMVGKGLLVNVLSDYLWARAILLMGAGGCGWLGGWGSGSW